MKIDMKLGIGAAIVVVILVCVYFLTGYSGGQEIQQKYRDVASGISFFYPSSVFPSLNKDADGTIMLENKASSSSPSVVVAILRKSAAEIDQTYNFYKSSELQVISSGGQIDTSTTTIVNGINGYLVTGIYADQFINYFVTKNVSTSTVIAVEMLIPKSFAKEDSIRTRFEGIFRDIVGSFE